MRRLQRRERITDIDDGNQKCERNENINNKVSGDWSISGTKVVGPNGKEITNLVKPSCLAIAHHNPNLLLVGDDGAGKHVVFIYNISGTPVIVDTIGILGGIAAGTPWLVDSFKIWGYIKGVGTDNTGNIYVVFSLHNTNSDIRSSCIRSYSPDGNTLLWELANYHFVDNVAFDPTTDGKDLYSYIGHYKVDYSKTDPGTEWSQFGVTYNMDESDPRDDHAMGSIYFIWKNGKRYMFRHHEYGGDFTIYEFDDSPSELAHYIGVYDQFTDTYGKYVDDNGNIWEASQYNGVYKTPFLGTDEEGKPKFGPVEHWPMPEPMTNLQRIVYSPSEDAAYLTGYDEDFRIYGKNIHGVINAGPTVAVYDEWHTGNPKLRWIRRIPYWQPEIFGNEYGSVTAAAVDEAGDYFFIGYGIKDYSELPDVSGPTLLSEEVTRLHSKYNPSNGWVRVYRKSDGSIVGRMVPDSAVNYEMGWLDLRESLAAMQRSTGEYNLLVEEGWKARNILYRWCPDGTCMESDMSISMESPQNEELFYIDSTISFSATVNAGTSEITKVQFIAKINHKDSVLFEDETAPYQFDWEDAPKGDFTVFAKCFNSENASKQTPPVLIRVNDGNPYGRLSFNQKKTYFTFDSIVVSITGTDFDGTIDSTELFIDGVSVSQMGAAPFQYIWKSLMEGEHFIHAVVIDNDGKKGYTDTLDVKIFGNLPSVIIPQDAVNGLIYDYFHNSFGSINDMASADPIRNGFVKNISISNAIRRDNFGFYYYGYIKIPVSGLYTFYTNSDDGSVIYIDSIEIVNNDGLHAPQERSGSALLEAGVHYFSALFFEQGGGEEFDSYIKGPGFEKWKFPIRCYTVFCPIPCPSLR
ncbi:MAG: hypothetical protein HC906_05990 [Bacteroidales bacterium]|nr:hypothetical protein [Bacteroidales bacterium]